MSWRRGQVREINFDGLIGPSHNYAGLSRGNRASVANAGAASAPRAAALQGLAKMRRMLDLGLRQGILLPHDRPHVRWLRQFGFTGTDAEVVARARLSEPTLFAETMSASAMWAANAATVTAALDCSDGRCHLSLANLATMRHRMLEPRATQAQLELAFGDWLHFAVHAPLPTSLGDEGAANHMRLAASHGQPGINLFVYGAGSAGGFPARQHRDASAAIARRHGLDPARVMRVAQNPAAIAAGAFHNDVVAVANEYVLLAHEEAFADRWGVHDFVQTQLPGAVIIEAPATRVSLDLAVASYVFNSQLVTLADGEMVLVVPRETRDCAPVWTWLGEVVANPANPIGQIEVVELRQSMRNGGGPACLRLRVPVDAEAEAAIDPRFLLDPDTCDAIEAVIARYWPARIEPGDLGNPDLWRDCREARAQLLACLGFERGEL